MGTTTFQVRITHPFHPLRGRVFNLICRRTHWAEDRVVYEDDEGRLCTIASAFTDIDAEDEFRRASAGRAAFRSVDLLALCLELDRLVKRVGGDDA